MARRSAAWALGSRVGSQICQFLGLVITARLLLPEDYGIAAIVFPIVTFAGIFSNLGLGTTVIHARRITEKLLSTAFFINLGTAVALTGIVAVLAVPLSRLYDEPRLVPVIWLASLTFLVTLNIVQVSLLERTLRFKRVAIIETACTVLGISVTVLTAALGAGPYSLILGPLCRQASYTVVMWSTVRWFPRALPDRASVRQFWTMSRGITGFQLVNFWSRNADSLILARFVSLTELGNYSRAWNVMLLPIAQMQAMTSRVLFPAMARLRDDRPRLSQAWLRALSAAGAVTAPVAIGMAVAAPALVEALFGRRWLGMVTVLELLAVSALPQTVASTVPALLRATGATDTLFRVGLLVMGLSLAAIAIGLPWGTVGVALALMVKFFIEMLLALRVALRQTTLAAGAIVRAIGPAWVACLPLVAAALPIRVWASDGMAAWQVLLLQMLVGGVAYTVALLVLDRDILAEGRRIVARVRRRRAGRSAT